MADVLTPINFSLFRGTNASYGNWAMYTKFHVPCQSKAVEVQGKYGRIGLDGLAGIYMFCYAMSRLLPTSIHSLSYQTDATQCNFPSIGQEREREG